MLDIKFIRENQDIVRKTLTNKNISLDLQELLALDEQISQARKGIQDENTLINSLSSQTKDTQGDEKAQIIAKSKEAGDRLKTLKEELRPLEEKFDHMMLFTPTIPAEDVPIGKNDEDNVVIREVGKKPAFEFTPLDHVDLIEKNGWGDFKRIPEVCGSRSASLKGHLLKYEMALWQFTLDKLMGKGFTPMSVPVIVREAALTNMGQFPFDRESVYHLPKDDMYLAGTAEVILNSVHSGEMLKEEELPIMYAGFSPCFRREAGAAGKDTRGLFRVHQFNKVEQYIICKADVNESDKMHKFLLANTEEIMQELELPYRVIECCTGDMGAGKYRMHDVESWCPLQERYRETHSCSTLLDWQARRTNLRYKDKETGKMVYAHTLNNTGIATPRIFVSLLENHQQKDGSIRIPKALQPYMNGAEFIGKLG